MDFQDQPTDITVIKKNAAGQETWRYPGRLLERGRDYLILEAFFDRDDMNLEGLFLCRGDRFVETWYTRRWYNIFEIHAREDDQVRGWYCNIGRPAQINGAEISYEDLSLDLIVLPDGQQHVQDEEEFENLNLAPAVRQQALDALQELRDYFNKILAN
jgi:predicted RNA-binding protein associated with RNAse of E/G family